MAKHLTKTAARNRDYVRDMVAQFCDAIRDGNATEAQSCIDEIDGTLDLMLTELIEGSAS